MPRWNARYTERPREPLSRSHKIHVDHGRENSKHSQIPILDDYAYSKEARKPTPLGARLSSLGLGGWSNSGQNQRNLTADFDAEFLAETRRRNRNLKWLIGAVVVVISSAVILGTVLGTYVRPGFPGASTEQPSSGQASPVPTTTQPNATPTSTKFPRPEMQLASVTVTGWTDVGRGGSDSISLFWQNREGYISKTTYNSTTGNWTRTMNFVKAKKNTPIAASTVKQEFYEGQEVSCMEV